MNETKEKWWVGNSCTVLSGSLYKWKNWGLGSWSDLFWAYSSWLWQVAHSFHYTTWVVFLLNISSRCSTFFMVPFECLLKKKYPRRPKGVKIMIYTHRFLCNSAAEHDMKRWVYLDLLSMLDENEETWKLWSLVYETPSVFKWRNLMARKKPQQGVEQNVVCSLGTNTMNKVDSTTQRGKLEKLQFIQKLKTFYFIPFSTGNRKWRSVVDSH